MVKLCDVCESLEFRAPIEGELVLAEQDRKLLARVSEQLGEALELARQARPLLELAVAFIPEGDAPLYIKLGTVRRRLRTWLR